MDSSPRELKLTSELLEYAKAVAITEAKNLCSQPADCDNLVQEALMHLHRKPPKFDPSKGANEKTLIYTVVHYAVIKASQREARHAQRFKQFPEPVEGEDPVETQISENHRVELIKSRYSMDDILEFIDNEESRALCRLAIECDCNLTEVARRMKLSEGTIRYRLKMLGPKLRAAGFDPFKTRGTREHDD